MTRDHRAKMWVSAHHRHRRRMERWMQSHDSNALTAAEWSTWEAMQRRMKRALLNHHRVLRRDPEWEVKYLTRLGNATRTLLRMGADQADELK